MNQQALEYARSQGYLTSDGKSQDLRRAWMKEAQALNVPFVEIVLSMHDAKKGAGAKLVWETLHLPPDVTTRAKLLTGRCADQYRKARVHYGAPTSGAIGPIPLDAAKDLAVELVSLATPAQDA